MNEKLNIPVMFCFDTNYVIPAAAAFYSLLEHANKKYDYTFYVLHSDITDIQQQKLKETIKEFKNCELKFIDMNHRLDDFWNQNYRGGHFSKEVMYKLLVASIFPNIDKLIVSDVDVIFLGDISQSYFDLTDKDDAYIAGVKPIGKINKYYLESYEKEWTADEIKKMGNICGGYLVMNLKKIRKDNFEDVFLQSLKENGHRLNQMEQDIFNITCYGKLKNLHLKYVACSYMWDYYEDDYDMETDTNYSKKEIKEAMENPVQLHYATSIKPWKNVDCTKSEIWFKYIVKTPFLREYLEKLPDNIITSKSSQRGLKSRIISFFDNNDDKKIWRYLRYIYTSINMIIKHPSKLFNGYIFRKIYRKIFIKPYNIVESDELFPSLIIKDEELKRVYLIDEFSNYNVITCGSVLRDNNEKIPFNHLINKVRKKYFEYGSKLYSFDSYDSKEFIDFLNNNDTNPLFLINFRYGSSNELTKIINICQNKSIPYIVEIVDERVLKNKKILKSIINSKCFYGFFVNNKNIKNIILEEYLYNNIYLLKYKNLSGKRRYIKHNYRRKQKLISKVLKKIYRR